MNEDSALDGNFSALEEMDGDVFEEIKEYESREALRQHFNRMADMVRRAKEIASLELEEYVMNSSYAMGTQGGIEKGANVVGSKLASSISRLYGRHPEIFVKPRLSADARLRSELHDTLFDSFPVAAEAILQAMLGYAKMTEVVVAAIQTSRLHGYGVIKLAYTGERRSAGIMQDRAATQEDLAVKLQTLAKNEEGHDDETIRLARQTMAAQRLLSQVDQTRSQDERLELMHVMPHDFLIDPSVKSFHRYDSARWMSHQVDISVDDAAGIAGKSTQWILSRMTNDNSRMGMEHEQQVNMEYVTLHETWERETGKIWKWLSPTMGWTNAKDIPLGGRTVLLKLPETSPLTGDNFYPFILIPDEIISGRFKPLPMMTTLRPLQDWLNSQIKKMREVQETYQVALLVNGQELSKEDLDTLSWQDGPTIRIIKGQTPFTPIQHLMMPMPGPGNLPQNLFDLNLPRLVMEIATNEQDPERSIRTKSATEVGVLDKSLDLSVDYKRHMLEEAISKLAQKSFAYLVAFADRSVMMDEYGLQTASWPDVANPEQANAMISQLNRLFEIYVQTGSTEKKDEREQLEQVMLLVERLQPLMDSISVSELQGIPANHKRALLRLALERLDDTIDPSLYMPAPMTQQAAQFEQSTLMATQNTDLTQALTIAQDENKKLKTAQEKSSDSKKT